MTKKTLGLVIAVIAGAMSFTSAVNYQFSPFDPNDPIGQKFADAQFFAPGNDYAGSFFWLPTQQVLPAETVTLGVSTRNCTKMLRGLYFSNAWGARLWPIDQQTLSGLVALDPAYSGLSFNGGLYTSCTNPANPNGSLELYSIYGQLNYTWKGKNFSLSVGRRYDVTTNAALSGGPLVSSLQYFNNQSPLGYFYDNIAGLWFVGGVLPSNVHDAIIGDLNNGWFIDSIFKFDTGSTTTLIAHTNIGDFTLSGSINAGLDTLWRIAVLGNVLLSKWGLGIDDRRSVLGNPNQTSIIVSDKMNISNSINQLKRNASSLCRGKKVYDETTWTNSTANVVCIGTPADDFLETDPVVINLANTSDYNGKTIIVYAKNVVLQDTMPQSNDYALNLFIDRGNVELQENGSPSNHFDGNGNLGGMAGTVSANFIRGNIFVNGIILPFGGTPLQHKLYVHGKFSSLNTGLEPTTERKTQIEALFTNNYTTYGQTLTSNLCNGVNCINFNNIFAWQCLLSGLGTDGNACNIAGDRFKYNPFIVIDTLISTPLLQN